MLALFAASLKAPKQNWFLRMVIILSFIPHHIILILFFFTHSMQYIQTVVQ